MTEFPRGIDISKYQYSSDGSKKPNFDIINAKCAFVGVRAGISWGYTDPWFSYTWQHLSVPRMAYHVIYPGEDARRQVDHFLNIVKPGEHDRLVLDMELDHGYNKTRITDTLLECLALILENTGRYPVIYSRASWVNQFLDVSSLPKLDWWLAGYRKPLPSPLYTPEATPPPALPKGVDNWLIHQTCERGNGSEFGVASHYVDIDRWNGTDDDVRAYFGLIEPPTEPPTDPDQPLYSVKITTTPPNRYITYNAPNGVRWNEERWLQSGDIVPVWEESGYWLRIDSLPRWINGSYTQWVKRVDTPQPPATEVMYYGALYWQRDPRWKDKPLGTISTIGENGCAMTCVAIALGKLGVHVNPVSLNDWLTNNEGYYQNGNLILWDAVERMNPTIKWDGMTYAPSDDLIRQRIRAGKLPIIVVDSNEATPQEDMHWVVGIGIDARGRIVIHDPWDNAIIAFRDRYKKPVIRFTGYSRK